MVVKMSAPGRSFGGWRITACTTGGWWGRGIRRARSGVEWTETRNLATEQGDRAARIMAATAEASPELKRLAGGAATGRKLEKPVCHYSLNWAKEEKPDRQEMLRAAEGSLKALGMERHQALIVSHRDGQPHVHVIANRVDPESGKAAGLSRSQLRLSKWAERYEREQGKIRCPARERNNKRREAGGAGCGWARAFGRALQAGTDESAAGATGNDSGTAGRAGAGASGLVAGGGAHARGADSAVAAEGSRETGEAEQVGVVGALRAARAAAGSSWRKTAMECWGASGLGGNWAANCERSAGRSGDARKCWGAFERSWRPGNAWSGSRLGKAHSEAVRKIESLAGRVYRNDMEGAEGRAREATRRDPLAVYNRYRGGDWDRLKRSVSEERMEQVREFDGEPAYEKMMRAMEKADQEKARKVEKARANGEGNP